MSDEIIRRIKAHIRERDLPGSGLPESELAELLIGTLKPSEKRALVLDWLKSATWDIRRERQLQIEREASKARQQTHAAPVETYEQRQTRRQKEIEELRDAREFEWSEIRPKYEQWFSDPASVPREVLLRPRSLRDSVWEVQEFEVWRDRIYTMELECEYFGGPERHRLRVEEPLALWLLAVCEAHGIPRDDWADVLFKWGRASSGLALSIHDQIEEAAAAIRLELTSELLGSVFALGDGIRVTWADATAEQHRQRAEMTTANAVANAEDAARHLVAVRMIEAGSVETLGELVSPLADKRTNGL